MKSYKLNIPNSLDIQEIEFCLTDELVFRMELVETITPFADLLCRKVSALMNILECHEYETNFSFKLITKHDVTKIRFSGNLFEALVLIEQHKFLPKHVIDSIREDPRSNKFLINSQQVKSPKLESMNAPPPVISVFSKMVMNLRALSKSLDPKDRQDAYEELNQVATDLLPSEKIKEKSAKTSFFKK